MGQNTIGVLYGADVSEMDTDEAYELGQDFNRHKGIASWATCRRVRFEGENSKALLGVWVAGHGEDGEPRLDRDAIPLGDFEASFAEEIRAARAMWDEFSAYARERGVVLAEARTWLTPCEVA